MKIKVSKNQKNLEAFPELQNRFKSVVAIIFQIGRIFQHYFHREQIPSSEELRLQAQVRELYCKLHSSDVRLDDSSTDFFAAINVTVNRP